MNKTAQGIASKGRFGDTTLVHMAPSELKGIEQLAGMPTTINPETGLPEMFNFKEFLAVAAPIAGAALLGPAAATAFGGSIGATAAGALGAGGGAALGTLVAGGNSDEALQAGLVTGLTAGIGGSMFGGAEKEVTKKAGQKAVEQGVGSAATPAYGDIATQGAANVSAAPFTNAGGAGVDGISIASNAGRQPGIMGAFRDTAAYQNPAQAFGYGTAGGVGGLSVLPGVADTLVDDSPKYGDIEMSDPYRRRVTYPRGIGSREGQFFDPSGMYIKEGGYIKKMQEGGTVGIVNGMGDGMSDSIYGTMRDNPNQRVALSDGEFVIPADVVSGIGNGSTDAGAKQLYAMMDGVRRARTGQRDQAPEINPEEFLPA